jgi:hypothetical protein
MRERLEVYLNLNKRHNPITYFLCITICPAVILEELFKRTL